MSKRVWTRDDDTGENTWEPDEGGGGVPDPSAAPDGDVVTVEGGVYVLQPGGGSLSVGDGETTVDPATSIVFTGATVTDGGGGEADVAIAGGSIPDSWLVVYPAAGLTANGNAAWTLGGNMGDDINIDGGDATILNIVTPGTYDLIYQFDVAGDASGAGTARINVGGTITEIDWLADANNEIGLWTVIPASFAGVMTATLTCIAVAAPVTVQMNVAINATAGQITVGGGNTAITIRRTS